MKINLASTVAFLLTSLAAVGMVGAEAPEWLPDKAFCKYFVVKADGTFEENGLAFLPGNNSEGAIKIRNEAGVPCAGSSRLYYLIAAKWNELLKWRGAGNDIVLNIRYFDSAPGLFGIQYDSI